MYSLAATLLVLIGTVAMGIASDQATIEAIEASSDVRLQTDPASPFWNAASSVFLEKDKLGTPVPGFRSEVRVRWTKNNLYFLFICAYDELFVKNTPVVTRETNELWNWDVAEVFIGSDFHDVKHYREFELSPQGEWVDLDIDLKKPQHEDGWTWNSGFTVNARIDATKHRWYAAMRIPFSALDRQSPADGSEFRLNLFVSEGPPSNHHALTWQSPMSDTFHVPERFGLLRLVSGKP
jgi:hypothetical protein